MANLFERILRAGDKRILKRLRSYVSQINALEDSIMELTDDELHSMTDQFRERYAAGESLDDMLPEAFAVVREASQRTLGMRHFDVQMMGAAALHLGNIAEMKTGEGKTLVATAAAYLNAISGKGVHVVTTNDFLANYQGELMSRLYRFLGMSTGVIVSNQKPAVRREQYAADITYGTNNEFGFDYLRDNMAWSKDELVQRGHNFAIVDEVDSILIDEARTPLIISGPAQGDVNRWYSEFSKLVRGMKLDEDYEVDIKKRTVGVKESGIDKVEDYLGIDNLYESANTPLIGFLNNAIKAKELFKRDKDYVVMNGEIMIVDEHTGRSLPGRRYSEGMHQAIEAKENVEIKAENQTLATVTLQNYFRLYDKLSGMTGTAETEAAEFNNTYKLGVVPIPTNKPMQRVDKPDLIYKNEISKFEAVAQDIEDRHRLGQPVLVGTTSVEKSEYLSQKLAKRGIRHEVLNAKQHEREAAVVAQAGKKGAVTVATNMAGRGTDIMLGGNAEFLAVTEMKNRGLDAENDPEGYQAVWDEVFDHIQAECEAEGDEVRELGGLYVLGTERHESRRIDNQLRGRSGRQGDPGESRFYLSMSDELMRRFNAGMAERIMNSPNMPDDMALESKMVSRAIESAQRQVESVNTEQRKNVLKYDDVMNRQREAIYADRRQILEGEDLGERIKQFIEDAVGAMVTETTLAGEPYDWDLDALWSNLRVLYPVTLSPEDLIEEAGGDKGGLTAEMLKEEIVSDAMVAYERREEYLGSSTMRDLERRVVLSSIGRKWQEHLYEMDYLKEGIGLRAMAQRDPLVEYQREGYEMFEAMMEAIREDSVSLLFHAEVEPGHDAGEARGAGLMDAQTSQEDLEYSAPDESGEARTRRTRAAKEGPRMTGKQARKAKKRSRKRH
ncbi:preprotein translocase subunit SecA [Arthrobacter sp. HMSC06H05]|uniref:Protein translocase subunit SecA n=2 Tax=Pseudoglutamicibacter albus TaxID=98671 RepID=A0A095YGZ2_9MICC|nr:MULTISPECIES: preprotein translocase subunit SecA [Micrococcaceae]KGF21279.1 preprotein translocase subunit SecA [Pseudoglutamicibacter albus DNF00011]KGF21538.1 preprotein translocase subunit SecA [Pseudoglutamicibacter albus DNF00011]MCG7304706.1 preprotein translocase subunit SecA [Pseudoglutamicibacter albus]MDR7293867.1 preprotein translocase subunit SecA [Pseudoglutamicibacter albus]OFT43044.1 preprotein translocase subunit SecA [Arthrobacter sp. HMSC06H05]